MNDQDREERQDGSAGEEKQAERPWPPSPMPVPPYPLHRRRTPAMPAGGRPVTAGPRPAPAPASPPPAAPAPVAPRAAVVPVPVAKVEGQSPSGAEIKEARERAGMTQLELARRVGRSRSFIALVEQGRRRASEEDLQRLREVLGL